MKFVFLMQKKGYTFSTFLRCSKLYLFLLPWIYEADAVKKRGSSTCQKIDKVAVSDSSIAEKTDLFIRC